jgi:hypothetical protein
MKHSLSKAARLAGVARSTLYEAIHSGKIATETDGRGRKVIDQSELLRVFGALQPDGQSDNGIIQPRTGATTPTDTPTAVLEERIKGLEALLSARDEMIKGKDAEINAYREREQRLMQLLAPPAPSSEPPTPAEPAPKRRRWWGLRRR